MKLPLYICIYVSLATIIENVQVLLNSEEELATDRRKNEAVHLTNTRNKRVATIIGAGVIAGMRAAKFLLSGTKEVPSFRMYSRTFQKPGDYNQAVKDFDSVNPTHVQDFILPNVLEGKVGRVGDRTILIESIGEQGRPIMEIFQTIGTRTDKVDRIIYMD